jgi:RNA polymerase subunit RPABC4/transcription elongation factor Spt4
MSCGECTGCERELPNGEGACPNCVTESAARLQGMIVAFLRAEASKWLPVANQRVPCIASVNAGIHCAALLNAADAIEAGQHVAPRPNEGGET